MRIVREMSASASSKTKRNARILLTVIVIVAVILLAPPALAQGFNVPLSKVVFGETTGSLSHTSANVTVSTVTAYEYYFSVRSGGMVRSTDTSVSSSGGTVIVTLDLKLTNPSGTTVDLGNTTVTGGIGTRMHTLYLSVDQGVRASGSYSLNIIITANITLVGVAVVTLSSSFSTTFDIS